MNLQGRSPSPNRTAEHIPEISYILHGVPGTWLPLCATIGRHWDAVHCRCNAGCPSHNSQQRDRQALSCSCLCIAQIRGWRSSRAPPVHTFSIGALHPRPLSVKPFRPRRHNDSVLVWSRGEAPDKGPRVKVALPLLTWSLTLATCQDAQRPFTLRRVL